MISMRQLMEDPVYRAYMKKRPPADVNPFPEWQIWVHDKDRRWLTATFPTYEQVWAVFVKRFRYYRDTEPTITSRRRFYAPPGEWYKVKVRCNPTLAHPKGFRIEDRWRTTFTWDDWRSRWCGRCRRPVEFQPLFETHHALKRMPVVSDEDNMRCPICGIRESAQPGISQMIKLA